MDRYVTGAVIRRLRENKRLTQDEPANKTHVSGKAVSKWETGQGFPENASLSFWFREALFFSQGMSGVKFRAFSEAASQALRSRRIFW